MLVLSRHENESIVLGDDIVITVVRINSDQVKLGIEAPHHVKILRGELERVDVPPATGER